MYYYGSFHGNWHTTGKSAFFLQPVLWMHSTMNTGDYIDTTNQYYNLYPDTRLQQSNPLVLTRRTILFDHYSTYTVPETGVTYSDVIYFGYYPNTGDLGGLEEYWCAKGLSWVRARVAREGLVKWAVPDLAHDPVNGASWGYGADGIDSSTSMPTPKNPWYSPFPSPVGYSDRYNAYVPYGSFEGGWIDIQGWYTPYQYNYLNTGPSCVLYGAGPSSSDNESGFNEAGIRSLGLSNYGDLSESSADHVEVTNLNAIPVVPGETCVFSGWIKRTDASTSSYIAVWAGSAYSQADSTVTSSISGLAADGWEKVSTTITIPSGVYAAGVKCRIDADPGTGWSFFDDIRLQLAP